MAGEETVDRTGMSQVGCADRTGGRVGEHLRSEVAGDGSGRDWYEVDLVLELLSATAVKRKAHRRQAESARAPHGLEVGSLPEKAIDVARMCYRHTERIAKHPDAKDLNFRCSAALLSSNLPRSIYREESG